MHNNILQHLFRAIRLVSTYPVIFQSPFPLYAYVAV